jgi:hypothetical protein
MTGPCLRLRARTSASPRTAASPDKLAPASADMLLAEQYPSEIQFNDRFTSFAGVHGHIYLRLSAAAKDIGTFAFAPVGGAS